MASCQYCRSKAGLFKKYHQTCKEKYEKGVTDVLSLVSEAAVSGVGFETLETRLKSIGEASFINAPSGKGFLVQGWEQALNHSLEDNILSEQEENNLMTFANKFQLSQEDLNVNGAYLRAAMGGVLREVLEGKTPSRMTVTEQLPINLQKSESLIWLFSRGPFLEERTRTTYEGSYQGMSVKVMKGLYYRVGGFRGNPVQTTRLMQIDEGQVVITSKHFYFAGSRKSFRIPYKKIISFKPYSDGIGLFRDLANAKQQIFVTGEGWFIYNLVMNLAQQAG